MAEPGTGYSLREAFAAILVGDGPTAAQAASAIELLGGRILQRIGWAEAAGGIAVAAPAPVIVVEAWGIAADTIVEGLAAIDAFAGTREMPVVVAFDETQIDLVAAHLFGRHVQPLCEPSIAERIGALAVAAELTQAPVLHDPWRESEATRLQRLNAEVARIAEILARLTRDEPGGGAAGDVADRRRGYEAGPGGGGRIDAAKIRRMIRARRLRDHFFGPGLFEDPAWDMLLDLFAAELEGRRVSVSSLCIAAAVAPTTALRWISKLTDNGLFVRQPDVSDRRRAFMALSTRASEAMRGYVAAAYRADTGVA